VFRIDAQYNFFTTGEFNTEDVMTAVNSVADADDDEQPRRDERGNGQVFMKFSFMVAGIRCNIGSLVMIVSADEEIKNQAGDDERGEQAGGNTDGERHAEAFDRTSTHENQMMDEIRVVTCESKMVPKARS